MHMFLVSMAWWKRMWNTMWFLFSRLQNKKAVGNREIRHIINLIKYVGTRSCSEPGWYFMDHYVQPLTSPKHNTERDLHPDQSAVITQNKNVSINVIIINQPLKAVLFHKVYCQKATYLQHKIQCISTARWVFVK